MGTTTIAGVAPFVFHLPPRLRLDRDDFTRACRDNPGFRLELSSRGELTIMPPTGGETSSRNAAITFALVAWHKATGLGKVFDSSGGFVLPGGAIRSPDASWVRGDRYASLGAEERAGFLPLCPDFVVELRSPSDRLSDLEQKMVEWMAAGVQLGWLIDPIAQRVHVSRAGPSGASAEMLDRPASVEGDPVLPGFRLELADIW